MTKWLRSFHSSRGGGANGHVVIMTGTNAAWYNSLTNNAPPFDVPVHPGPPAVPAGATQHQILEYNRQYAHITGECNLIAALERTAMTCITDNWDESHYFELSDPNTGYTNVTVAQIINHIRNAHGTPDRHALQQNMTNYRKPHNMEDTVSTTLMSKKKCQAYAAGTLSAISDGNLLHDTLASFEATGNKRFVKAVQLFEKLDPAQQTGQTSKRSSLMQKN